MTKDQRRIAELEDRVKRLERQQAIYNATRVTGNQHLTGWCQNDCGEPTAGAYCSKECRRDHTLRMRN